MLVDLPEQVKQADILIAAVGRAQMVKKSWLKPGVVDIFLLICSCLLTLTQRTY